MFAKQPVSINGIEFDALIDEQNNWSATIPEYAVEDGHTISDDIIVGAEQLSLTLFVTDTPVSWKSRHGSYIGRSDDVIDDLKNMYFSGRAVTISTTRKTYKNMGIESLSVSRSSDTGYAKEVQVTCKKINITKTKTTTIPSSYGKSGSTEASAGTANTKSGSSGSGQTDRSGGTKSSILYSAAETLGLL